MRLYRTMDEIIARMLDATAKKEAVSLAYHWEYRGPLGTICEKGNVKVELGSDQTSLHNPWAGGYYPAGLTFEESNELMVKDPRSSGKPCRHRCAGKWPPSTG